MDRFRRHTKRVLIGIVGGLVTLIGLILIPYPGPGWLIVFGGLAILATEFAFASKLLDFLKAKYEAWVSWLKRQNVYIRALVLVATAIVVVLTVWLLNGFGILNDLLRLNIDVLESPLLR